MNPIPSQAARARALSALALLVPFPSFGVLLAMYVPATRGTAAGAAAYTLAKLWLFLLPLVWLKLVDRKPLGWSPPRRGGLGTGALLGLAVAALIIMAHVLLGPSLIDAEHVRDQAVRNGIGTPERYLLLAVYLSFINALLEEYVWRWFVYRRCETLMKPAAAIPVSAACFTLHHIFALKAQLDWTAALIGSFGVFGGGVLWSWCYRRYRSIWPGYVSHLIVDVAVFAVGWLVIF